MFKNFNDLFCFIFSVYPPLCISMWALQSWFCLMQFFNFFFAPLILFSDGFRNSNNFPVSQVVQFQDFLLRANKYNCLKMVGDGGASDHKLILVEVRIFTISTKHCYCIHKCMCFLSLKTHCHWNFHLPQEFPNQFYRQPGSLHDILRWDQVVWYLSLQRQDQHDY